MKKLAFISGIISANLMMFGSLFKIFHWPFASVMLVLATSLFALIFLPTSLISWYNSSGNKSVFLPLATFVVFFMGSIAILFKIQHWPHGMELFMASLPLPFIIFLPTYLIHTRKDKNDMTFIPVMMGLVFIAVFGVLLSVK